MHADQDSTSQASCVRSSVFINGAATPLRNARTLGVALVDVNGQNAAAALRSRSTQRALLDRLASAAPLAAQCAAEVQRLTRLRGRIAELSELEDEELRQGELEALARIEALQVRRSCVGTRGRCCAIVVRSSGRDTCMSRPITREGQLPLCNALDSLREVCLASELRCEPEVLCCKALGRNCSAVLAPPPSTHTPPCWDCQFQEDEFRAGGLCLSSMWARQ